MLVAPIKLSSSHRALRPPAPSRGTNVPTCFRNLSERSVCIRASRRCSDAAGAGAPDAVFLMRLHRHVDSSIPMHNTRKPKQVEVIRTMRQADFCAVSVEPLPSFACLLHAHRSANRPEWPGTMRGECDLNTQWIERAVSRGPGNGNLGTKPCAESASRAPVWLSCSCESSTGASAAGTGARAAFERAMTRGRTSEHTDMQGGAVGFAHCARKPV